MPKVRGATPRIPPERAGPHELRAGEVVRAAALARAARAARAAA
jgi:hypothetical protein